MTAGLHLCGALLPSPILAFARTFLCRYYELELPLSLKKGYFFEAAQVQGHEHANVSKVLPHLLVGLTSVSPGVDLPLDLAIAWRLHQMIAAGVSLPGLPFPIFSCNKVQFCMLINRGTCT